MKPIYLFIALVVLSCSTSYAESLQKTMTLSDDLQKILKNYPLKFSSGLGHWTEELGTTQEEDRIFSGSTFIVFDDSTGATPADEAMAEHVCRGFQKLYGLDNMEGGGGGSNHRSSTEASQSGDAYFVWIKHNDNPATGEKIVFHVQVVALREAKIGFILTFVHVPTTPNHNS